MERVKVKPVRARCPYRKASHCHTVFTVMILFCGSFHVVGKTPHGEHKGSDLKFW